MKSKSSMKNIDIIKLLKGIGKEDIIILILLIVLTYLLGSIYFINHFFFNTVINGVDVSLKSHDEAEDIIGSYAENYKLQLIERGGETEEITGREIGMKYNEKAGIHEIFNMQNSFQWISALLTSPNYYVNDLYIVDAEKLENKIYELNCLNKIIIEPQNVSFRYSNGSYEEIKEIYGNKIMKDKLYEAVKSSILEGKAKLDLDANHCYENPKYTISSHKTPQTKNLLNKYVSTKITYIFGNQKEMLDGNTINKYLSVDENLDAVISEIAVMRYVKELGRKYNTVGTARNFKTSMGKTIEVEGGLYGWKIDQASETKALLENIKHGEILEREPVYAQRALSRGKDEIGNTYVEINITRQQLWFYKNGKLIAQGAVVTGNPNRGYATVTGVYMLNYKQQDATLSGPDYEAGVTYWMPFFGNTGIHDASWRYSFGGSIYKRNGTHGCVNAPFYLAKRIFENIEPGTPIICYEE